MDSSLLLFSAGLSEGDFGCFFLCKLRVRGYFHCRNKFMEDPVSTAMKLIVTILAGALASGAVSAQTDAYIKLFDRHGKHPRIESITYPGNANLTDMYNSIYGHGAVVENPWVAFRVYMDNRQSLDLYVKAKPGLELDRTGFYTTPEQLASGYGCDVLWAGPSIAAGSFRGWQNGSVVTIDTVAARTQRVIDSATVEVEDRDWIYNGHPVQMRQRYSVGPDSRDLSVEIELKGYAPTDVFAAGIQKLETDNRGFILPTGVGGSWGSNIPDKNHPELVEQVGLGIVVDPENIVRTIEDSLNYIVLVRPDADGKIRYRVIASGDRETGGFRSADQWLPYVKTLVY